MFWLQVRGLLAAGDDVNADKADGMLPLHFAATLGHVRVAELLLEHGARVDAVTCSLFIRSAPFPATTIISHRHHKRILNRDRLIRAHKQVGNNGASALMMAARCIELLWVFSVVLVD